MVFLHFSSWPIRRFFSFIHWSLQAFSQASVRLSGILLFLGGLIATGGCLEASLKPSPLAVTWVPSSWIVILGVLLLLAGMFGLYFQYILHPGIIGILGAMMLMIGAMIVVTGIASLDIFILPWIFKLGEILGQNDQIQTIIKQAMLGMNNATSTIGSSLGSGCQNSLAALIGQNCSSTMSASSILPATNSQPTINSSLSAVGIAPLDTLNMWGLTFLSGAPLALGCLLLGLTFLRAELKSRKALLLLISCASFNLASTLPILCTLFPGLLGGLLVNPSSFFVSHLYFLTFFSGVLLFLSIAGLGFTLWYPQRLDRHLSR